MKSAARWAWLAAIGSSFRSPLEDPEPAVDVAGGVVGDAGEDAGVAAEEGGAEFRDQFLHTVVRAADGRGRAGEAGARQARHVPGAVGQLPRPAWLAVGRTSLPRGAL